MKTLLVVGIVVGGAAIGFSLLVPVVECPDCGGESREWRKARGGPPDPEQKVWIGCPRCFDRGSVTLYNQAFRKPVGYRVDELVRSTDLSPQTRLVQAEGRTYGVILAETSGATSNGVRISLLDSDGQSADKLDVGTVTRFGSLSLEFVDPPAADGTVVVMRFMDALSSQVIKRISILGGRLRVLEMP